MDAERFKKNAPGRLVKIAVEWGADFAFIPEPLPPAWQFPTNLWPLLSEAKRQVGILEGLGRTLPNPDILLSPFSDREAIRSSRLEGTYASPQELLLFDLDRPESKSENDPVNDHREVFNFPFPDNDAPAPTHHGLTLSPPPRV